MLQDEKSGDEIVKWLTRAAEPGHVETQYRLGVILYEGSLTKRDDIAAVQWTLIALAGDHNEAKHLLREKEIFVSADELAEARKRANFFKSAKEQIITIEEFPGGER